MKTVIQQIKQIQLFTAHKIDKIKFNNKSHHPSPVRP